jgi:hypothetical protein
MDPSEITLRTPSKSFEYEKLSRDIDKIDNVEVLQNMLKTYVKLYFKQQETIKII